MDKNKFDKVVEAYFCDQEDHIALHEAFSWLAKSIWADSTYTPRSKDTSALDVTAEAVLVCFERRKKFGYNRRGKTPYDFFAWVVNTVYRHNCTWDKKRTKNGLKMKAKKVPKAPVMKADAAPPTQAKRWGSVKRSGWKPKTGTGE